VTQLGLQHTTVPVKEVSILRFARGYTYNGVEFPKNTEMIVSFARRAGKKTIIEGFINVGKLVPVIVYKPASAVFEKRLMPLKGEDG
jgi:hypothetical protein